MDEHIIDEVVIPAAAPRRLRFAAVKWNDVDYDNIVLREPTAGDVLEAHKIQDGVQSAYVLLQRVTQAPMQVILQLPQSVLEAAADYFETFSKPSPPKKPAT